MNWMIFFANTRKKEKAKADMGSLMKPANTSNELIKKAWVKLERNTLSLLP